VHGQTSGRIALSDSAVGPAGGRPNDAAA